VTGSPRLSVVIPAHNAADTLTEQLDGIARGLARAPDTEILVVDNRSTDSTADTARRWSESADVPVRIIDAAARAGEPYARNMGVDAALGELVCFCDADDIVSPTWLAAMARGLTDADYVTGPVDMHRLNEAWIADVRGTSVTEGRSVMYDTVPYAHGCNMGFRRSTLIGIGGFDESYTAACDLDIAIRMWEAGHDLRFEPEASIAYRLRPSLAATYRQGMFYGRYRIRIRRRLAAVADVGSGRRQTARRAAWLVRHAAPAAWSKSTRARWVWVAGQLRGERQGRRDLTKPQEHPR
jgi:glycosyltransferase involved in cell wall biosynthesis